MKVAFYVPNKGLRNVDFSSPEKGNPGSGAAEYLHVALPYYINSSDFEVFIYAQSIEKMPPEIKCVECEDIRDAAKKAKINQIDLFIFRPRIHEEENILELIDELKLPAIGRAALTPAPAHQRKMAKSRYFKALVAVGAEQYDYMCDSPISSKLTYIDNGISLDPCRRVLGIEKNERKITYMGALVYQKGFHILARNWRHILSRVPDATLCVIGSSRVYNEEYKLGPIGVADPKYEEQYIIPFLCDAKGKLLPSVKFLGGLGVDKYEHLAESIVAVANPTGQTETCCVSAIEMQACGTAVVTGAFYALLSTVTHRKTGLLSRGDRGFINDICRCLENPDYAKKMGREGARHTHEKYCFEVVSKQWKTLFKSINEGVLWKPPHEFKHLLYHRKWLRFINYHVSEIARRHITWPSVQELEGWMIKIMSEYIQRKRK